MPVKIFFCYAHEDENLLNKLKTHLKPLQRQGLIDVWHDRDTSAGTEWEQKISQELNASDIILVLVSPEFLASDYCFSVELARAYERHKMGTAVVIPIILRPSYWKGLLGNFRALPTDGIPVNDRFWGNMDKAFLDITEGVSETIKVLLGQTTSSSKKIGETNENIFNDSYQYTMATLRPLFDRIKASPIRSTLEPSLYIAVGKEPGQVYDINNSLRIGRLPNSDIFLEDPLVSRVHALVYLDNIGTCILKDIGSSNGTFINRISLKKDEPHILKQGDEIELGNTLLVFRKGQASI